MRVLIFTSDDSIQARRLKELQTELERDQVSVRTVGVNSAGDVELAELYDITSRPAVAIVQDDGQMVQRWLGEPPAAGDIAYWVHL